MYACDNTGEIPIADLGKWTRVDMTVAEAQELSTVVPALRVVRGYGEGQGEICIPIVGGWIDKIRIMLDDYRPRLKRKKTTRR